jgi:outer membrane murein-binding lipoprotein Lpp
MKKILTIAAIALAAVTLTGCSAGAAAHQAEHDAEIAAAIDEQVSEQVADHEAEIAALEAQLATAEEQVAQCTGQSNAYREAAMAVTDATVAFLDDMSTNIFTPELIAPVDLTVAEGHLAEAKSYLCDGSY